MKARRSATHLAFDPQMIPLAYCTPRLIIAGWILPTLPKLNRNQFKFKKKHIIIDTKPNCCSLSIYTYLTLSYSSVTFDCLQGPSCKTICIILILRHTNAAFCIISERYPTVILNEGPISAINVFLFPHKTDINAVF